MMTITETFTIFELRVSCVHGGRDLVLEERTNEPNALSWGRCRKPPALQRCFLLQTCHSLCASEMSGDGHVSGLIMCRELSCKPHEFVSIRVENPITP